MGKISSAYLMPHPPIIIPEVGGEEVARVERTAASMEACARDIAAQKPGVILVITPHGPVFQDGIAVYLEEEIKGDMARFRAPEATLAYRCHMDLAREIIRRSGEAGIMTIGMDKRAARDYGVRMELDHGAFVPLYYISKHYVDFQLVHITIGLLPYEEMYAFGKVIQQAVKATEENVVVLASGDLSHRLTLEAPAGYHPRGKELDRAIMGALGAMDVEGLINLDRDLIDCGGECGLRPILMMLGTLDGYQVDSKVLSYEGPFGVGYGVAWFHPGEYSSEKEKVQRFYENRKKANEQARKQEDAYVSLARTSLEEYVRTGKVMRIPENLPPEMLQNRAGIFVSIKKHGQLRGCIGTISPTCRNIAEEIIQNAISAGTKDYRFSPVEEWELEDLRYSVDVLKEPEDISSMEELDTVKYGVIVRKGSRSGLLLPNLAGVDTVEEQVAIALQKAGIRPDEKYKMQRFEVIRHT